jgi:hypothetical protein
MKMGKCLYSDDNPGSDFNIEKCPYDHEIECSDECMDLDLDVDILAIMQTPIFDCVGCAYESFRDHNPIPNCWLTAGNPICHKQAEFIKNIFKEHEVGN